MDSKLQQYLTWPLQPSSELCTWFVSHNWMTLFRGWGKSPPPKKRGSSRCMTTLNEEDKGCVTYCSHLASIVWTFRYNLLLWNHLANWNQTWHEMNVHWIVSYKTCGVVSKEGVSMLYMDFNYVSPSNEGRHIVLVWFFFLPLLLLLLLSEACPDHNFLAHLTQKL
jgi:hypothetical protein